MSTTITCFGGAGEIGGNKILLEDNGKRLMLDFGMGFGRVGRYFDGVFITERTGRGLLDPLALGLVPPLRGVLRDELVPSIGSDNGQGLETFWQHWATRFPQTYRDLRQDGPAVAAVLVSHAHLDHIGDLEYVEPEIPVAATCLTAFIAKTLQDIGGGSGAAYIHPTTVNGHGILQSDRSAASIRRPWIFLDQVPAGVASENLLASARSFWDAAGSKSRGLELTACQAFAGRIGPWQVRWWPVDHSVPGAVAFAIETEAGWVAYSGDLRFHGHRGTQTWTAAEGIAALKPVALLCEGTRLTGPNLTTEGEVLVNCCRVVQAAAGRLVVADFAPRNVDRFETFARIAAETGRQLLIQPKDAYLLRAVHLADPRIPDLMSADQVAVLDDPKGTYRKYETVVRREYAGRLVSAATIKNQLGNYILACSLSDMADMLDLQYLLGHQLDGVYLFSNSPAFDDEQQVDLVRLWHWTQHLGLTLVGLQPRRDERGHVVAMEGQPGYHASGHAGSNELQEFVRRIAPQKLIPIHTEAVGLWSTLLTGGAIEIVPPSEAQALTI